MKKFPILLLVTLGASLWFSPFFIDWVRYRDLPNGCGGVFTYSGETSGRHCVAGLSISSTESGFQVSAEFAKWGQFIAYGKRQSAYLTGTPCTDQSCDLSLALFRDPGDEAKWYCASSGKYANPESASYSLTLSGVGALPTPPAEQTIEINTKDSTVKINGDKATKGTFAGSSCGSDSTRCDFQFGEAAAMRVYVNAKEPMRTNDAKEIALGDVFVLKEDARSPNAVTLMQSKPNSGSTIAYDGNNITLKLNGLSAPASCPQSTPGTGTLSIERSSY